MGSDYFSRPRPRLFGHRGAAGVAPENTLESFRRAIADGAGYLELDVHASRDGAIIVIHDPTVDRTTDGNGAVRDLSLAELRRLDAGFRLSIEGAFPFRGRSVCIPTLEEVLEEFPDVPLNIEIKQADPPIEERVVSCLRENRALERTVLAAEQDAIMRRIRAVPHDLQTSLSAGEVREFFERWMAGELSRYRPPGLALQIPPRFGDIELVSEDSLEAAHERGLEVHLWTLNEPAEIERFLELDVDGVMSDFPATLASTARLVRDRRGRSDDPRFAHGRGTPPDEARMRAHPRSPLGAKGSLRFSDGRSISILIADVSFGGVRAELPWPGSPEHLVGKPLTLEIPALEARSAGKIGMLHGTVVRCDPAGPGAVSLGIRFAPGTVAKLKLVLGSFLA